MVQPKALVAMAAQNEGRIRCPGDLKL